MTCSDGTPENGSAHENGAEATPTTRRLQPTEHVGFDSLPDQYVSRIVRDGFAFNILIVGATGVGKSTLIDSLFNTKFPDVSTRSHNMKNVDLHVHSHELQEKSIKMRLSIVETRGYGDQINKTDSFKSIVHHIDEQFERYLQEELKIQRAHNLALEDSRIHCALYLISPVGHGLRAVDLETMKQLDSKVNLIPVIAKSDIITKNELTKLREKVTNEILSNGIRIYSFPTDEVEIAEQNSQMNALQPFAVVASHDFVRIGSRQVRARQYPWGTVQVENEAHCDFVRLREMLLRVNLEDLRESTHTKHYESYRRARLEQMGFGDSVDGVEISKNSTFQETFEARRSTHLAELKRKEEEMRQGFVLRVKEKEAELKEAERDLHAKFDALKNKHQQEKMRLEDERKRLDDELSAFSHKKTSVLSVASNSSSSLGTSLTLGGKSKKK